MEDEFDLEIDEEKLLSISSVADAVEAIDPPRRHKILTIAKKLALAEQICGHTFKNRDLLQSAITHPSAVEGQPVSASYERLEFLGDSILGSIVALSLFKSYPGFDEGKLTRLKVSLVSGMTLSEVGRELGID